MVEYYDEYDKMSGIDYSQKKILKLATQSFKATFHRILDTFYTIQTMAGKHVKTIFRELLDNLVDAAVQLPFLRQSPCFQLFFSFQNKKKSQVVQSGT